MRREERFRITKLHAGDKKITELYCDKAKNGDKFVCWGCGYSTETKEDFIHHFQKHIDDFLAGKCQKEK